MKEPKKAGWPSKKKGKKSGKRRDNLSRVLQWQALFIGQDFVTQRVISLSDT